MERDKLFEIIRIVAIVLVIFHVIITLLIVYATIMNIQDGQDKISMQCQTYTQPKFNCLEIRDGYCQCCMCKHITQNSTYQDNKEQQGGTRE